MAGKNRRNQGEETPTSERVVTPTAKRKPVEWVKAARSDIQKMPTEVQRELGLTLMAIQFGESPDGVSPFEGSKGGNVLKITENFDGDTYRLVYAAKFEKAIYMLHAFKKKSTSGIATPQKDVDTVWARYKAAEDDYKRRYEGKDS